MKKLFKPHFLLVIIALSALILGACGSKPEPSKEGVNSAVGPPPPDTPNLDIFVGPTTIAGIIIDQTGAPKQTGGESVKVTDFNSVVYPGIVTTDAKKNDVYTVLIGSNGAPPDALVANLGTSSFFYSWADAHDQLSDTTWVVLNNTNLTACLDLVFVNHDRSPVSLSGMTVELYSNGTGTGSPITPGGTIASGNGDNALHYRYTGINPSASYSFKCINATGPLKDVYGRNMARAFTTTAAVGANSTVGYTFIIK